MHKHELLKYISRYLENKDIDLDHTPREDIQFTWEELLAVLPLMLSNEDMTLVLKRCTHIDFKAGDVIDFLCYVLKRVNDELRRGGMIVCIENDEN